MTRLVSFATLSLAAIMLGACAALPDDAPIVEQLDNDTGATITRFGHPLELYRDTLVPHALGRYTFVAPFETNQAGMRELYLWVAVPIDSPADAEPPSVEVNGKALMLGAPGRDAAFAGLRQSPYKLPTPWSSMYYYKIDAATVATLADARDLGVHVSEATRNGVVRTPFVLELGSENRLKEFAARR
jgi:hypothetical protein